MKKVYAEVTTECNLHCPHCTIHNQHDGYNEEAFMKQLEQFDGEIILFGGEPTLYKDRLLHVYGSNPNITKKIASITTNMMKLDPDILEVLKKIKYIGTSWNPNRFTPEEYNIWKSNVDSLHDSGLDVLVMITLTEDLFEIDPDTFLAMVRTWDPKVITAIRFEYLVADGLTKDYYDRADLWQTDVYESWNAEIPMDVSNLDHWYFDCSETYTLHPNGELVRGCPNHKTIDVPPECYTCERMGICRPCMLHSHCSFPKMLAELVERNRHENETV